MSARPGADAPIPSPAFDLEARLETAFGTDPTPAQLAAIDRRVSAAVEIPRPQTRGVARPRRPRRPWRVVLLAAAALVVLVGAGTSLLSHYPLWGGGGGSGLAWDRSTKLGLSQVYDGYRVTLEAAYSDSVQTMLAISIADTKAGRESQLGFDSVVLTDEAGRDYQMSSGGSDPVESSTSVNMVWFDTPGDGALSGTHHFVLNMPDIAIRDFTPVFSYAPDGPMPDYGSVPFPWHNVSGSWRFEFDLAIAPAARLSPASTATVDGVTVTLGSVVVSPTTVRVQFRCAGLPDTGSGWAPVGAIVHNGQELGIGASWGGLDPSWGTIATGSGADSASGTWTVRIDELVGESKGGQIRLQGPWELRFTAP